MLFPTRFVFDTTENIKEGGVAAEVCSSQTGLWFCTLLRETFMNVYVRTTYDQIHSTKKEEENQREGQVSG